MEKIFQFEQIKQNLRETQNIDDCVIFENILNSLKVTVPGNFSRTDQESELFKFFVQTSVQISKNTDEFERFWFYAEKMFDVKNQKVILTSKYNSMNTLVAATQNMNKSCLKFVFEKFNKLFECSKAQKTLQDTTDEWLLDTLCQYAALAKCDAFELLWSFLQRNLSLDELKMIFLKKRQDGYNASMSCVDNKDSLTIEIVFRKVRTLFDKNHISKTVQSGDSNWVVQVLCEFAFKAKLEVFKIFWTFLQENLSAEDQKLVILQKNHKNLRAFMVSVGNPENETIARLVAIASDLFSSEDITAAAKSVNNNWPVETLCRSAVMADSNTFQVFWTFFRVKIENDILKHILLQKNPEGYNVLTCSAQNRNHSTIKFILDEARKLLSEEDFSEALKSENQNWPVDALYEYAFLATSNDFKIFYTFLQENYDDKDLTLILLEKNENRHNSLISSAQNLDSTTNEFIFQSLFELISCKKTTAPITPDSLVDTFCQYAAVAKAEAFQIFLSFLEKVSEVFDVCQKTVLLMNNQYGFNSLSCSAQNKDHSTIKFILELSSRLLSSEDVSEALLSKDQNWPLEALCQYASMADFEAFKLFWSYLRINLDEREQKSLFLKQNKNELNVLMSCAQNEDLATIGYVFEMAEELSCFDFESQSKLENLNLFVEMICHFSYWAELEALEIFWSALPENLKKEHRMVILIFLNPNREKFNLFTCSVRNKDNSVFKFVISTAIRVFQPSSFADELSDENRNQIGETLSKFAGEKCENFELFWCFVQKTLDKDQQEVLFSLTDEEGNTALMNCLILENADLSTTKFVIKTMRNLLGQENFATILKNVVPVIHDSLVDKLYRFAESTDSEAFKTFWSILQENFDEADLKSLLMSEDSNGCNSLVWLALIKHDFPILTVLNFIVSLADQSDLEDYKFFIIWFKHLHNDFSESIYVIMI